MVHGQDAAGRDADEEVGVLPRAEPADLVQGAVHLHRVRVPALVVVGQGLFAGRHIAPRHRLEAATVTGVQGHEGGVVEHQLGEVR